MKIGETYPSLETAGEDKSLALTHEDLRDISKSGDTSIGANESLRGTNGVKSTVSQSL